MADSPRQREAAHPTPFTYLKVAIVLAILTGVEVGVFYVDALEPAFLPIFLILSIAKFILVIMFYMHLKFDSRLFSSVFVGGVMLAIVVAVALMSLFQVLSTVANPPDEVVAAAPAEEAAELEDTEAVDGGPPVPPDTVEEAEVPEEAAPAPETAVEEAEVPEVVAAADPAAAGQEIFLVVPASAGPQALWCFHCHTIERVDGAAGLIGPDISHIGTDAATRKPGMSAEDYIRESIRDPEVFLPEVERSTPGLMTGAITAGLTDDEVDALVAFLLEQE